MEFQGGPRTICDGESPRDAKCRHDSANSRRRDRLSRSGGPISRITYLKPTGHARGCAFPPPARWWARRPLVSRGVARRCAYRWSRREASDRWSTSTTSCGASTRSDPACPISIKPMMRSGVPGVLGDPGREDLPALQEKFDAWCKKHSVLEEPLRPPDAEALRQRLHHIAMEMIRDGWSKV